MIIKQKLLPLGSSFFISLPFALAITYGQKGVLYTELDPTHVAEVHAVWQQVVLRIHTQSELHTTSVSQLILGLEEEA